MKIGIDCRMYGLKHAGIGRYVQNLVENLLILDRENEYVLFARNNPEEIKNSRPPGFARQSEQVKFKIVLADIPHYSLKEQWLLPLIVNKEKVDLLHFPHFNVPVFYFGKDVVTIHDLIKHTSRGMATTTRFPLIYWLKFLAYKLVFWLAIKRAQKVFVPSQFVKDELVKRYGLKAEKVIVTYEGVEIQSSKRRTILDKYNIQKPYLLYVGSVYPHKNIERLIEAIVALNTLLITNHQKRVTLVVVCARSVFWERLKEKVKRMGAEEYVNLTGFVPDEELAVLYREAKAFVFPSLSEGFGLPGLEAMAQGTPLVASDIPVFREVYGEGALYFNPLDPDDIITKIKELLENPNLQQSLRKQGPLVANRYSWGKMASKTLAGYNEVLK